MKSVVVLFGRMNPPTAAHARLVEQVIKWADRGGHDYSVALTRTCGDKKNPLPPFDKALYLMLSLPGHPHVGLCEPHVKGLFDHLKVLDDTGEYDHVYLCCGSDRADEYLRRMPSFLKHLVNVRDMTVLNLGSREGTESSTSMRRFAVEGQFDLFSAMCPPHMHPRVRKSMFDDVRSTLINTPDKQEDRDGRKEELSREEAR